MISELRETFHSGVTRPCSWRKKQLHHLRRMVEEKMEDMCDTVAAELHRTNEETYILEIGGCLNEIDSLLANMESLCAPKKLTRTLAYATDIIEVHKEPKGVILIITTWNVPYLLAIQGVAGAIAAGNCVVLKPSEIGAKSAAALSKWIPEYLDNSAIRVVCGGPEVTMELLEHKWDHILFTGSEAVGRSIAMTAARSLTPVTLELGGKS